MHHVMEQFQGEIFVAGIILAFSLTGVVGIYRGRIEQLVARKRHRYLPPNSRVLGNDGVYYSPINRELGIHMTILSFMAQVENGFIANGDGEGRYANVLEETNVVVLPSDVTTFGRLDLSFTHVVWYQKEGS